MIRGVCTTRLDGYERAAWPTVFAFAPRVGDRVEASDGRSLAVTSVTHAVDDRGRMLVRVELHR